MGRKPIKLKSYSRTDVYGRVRRRRISGVLRVALLLVLAAGVFAIGWFGASRCIDAITGFWYRYISHTAPADSEVQDSQPTDEQPPEDPDGQQTDVPQDDGSSEEVAAAAAALEAAGVFGEIPLSAFGSEDTLRTALTALAQSGADRALITLKDERGYVYYDSAQEMAIAGEAVRATADVALFVQLCDEYGLIPAVRLVAFRDPLAAYATRTAAVQYMSDGVLWLDTSLELGGRPWLNPYSEAARGYVLGLGQELAALGVQEVVYAGVQFPSGYSLEVCYYGENAVDLSRTDCLRECVAMLQSNLATQGVRTWFEWPTSAALLSAEEYAQNGNLALVYGEGPAALGAMRLLLTPTVSRTAEGAVRLPAADAQLLNDFVAAAGEAGTQRFGLALDVLAVDETVADDWRSAAESAGFTFFRQ